MRAISLAEAKRLLAAVIEKKRKELHEFRKRNNCSAQLINDRTNELQDLELIHHSMLPICFGRLAAVVDSQTLHLLSSGVRPESLAIGMHFYDGREVAKDVMFEFKDYESH